MTATAAVFVEDWLLPGGDGDDRQPAVPEAEARLDEVAALVRAAMMLRLVHAREHVTRDFPALASSKMPRDAAHAVSPVIRDQPLACAPAGDAWSCESSRS